LLVQAHQYILKNQLSFNEFKSIFLMTSSSMWIWLQWRRSIQKLDDDGGFYQILIFILMNDQ